MIASPHFAITQTSKKTNTAKSSRSLEGEDGEFRVAMVEDRNAGKPKRWWRGQN
jgi:hypothetical protein